MINIHEYRSLRDGPAVLFLGAIHGNETCGPVAINAVMKKLERGALALEKGSVIFVPVCNPGAYAKNKRYVDEDLNRVFAKSRVPKTYERTLANMLCPLVEHADVMIDLHSTGAKGRPTVFLDFPTKKNRLLAKEIGIDLAIAGWPELYTKDNRLVSNDTTVYANSEGKDCLLVECGQHADRSAPKIAERTILRVLAHYGLIRTRHTPTRASKKMRVITMTELFIKEHTDDLFSRKWKHLEVVKKGRIIGTRKSGGPIVLSEDRVMILPKYDPPVGKEWFYLGKYTE
ncbi:succinylglutamate desuccinylase/aspartoacylase family protein [Candidatus Kaiserbacteria bacterium]|nr:succinylglutamate desuccinylase/aspartoacylase family protein [Candidatus Kaiserbacteria bacterium]